MLHLAGKATIRRRLVNSALGVISILSMLKFPQSWRFEPPEGGKNLTAAMPGEAATALADLASKVASQGDRWDILEHFKAHTASAAGIPHWRSSTESYAASDLYRNVQDASANAPLLIEAFFDAFKSLRESHPDWWLPDESYLNRLLQKHRVGYQISGDQLLLLEAISPSVPLPDAPPPSLAETAKGVYQASVARAEQLLREGRPREAVQELLWLLETVATAFRGIETEAGTVAGKYFNQIARELRASHSGTTLDRALEWMTALHGYLSSPTGGGVRHGLDLNAGVTVSPNEGHLYCNLIRSYIAYLLGEHERLSIKQLR